MTRPNPTTETFERAEAILRAEELQLEAIGRIVAAPKCEAGGCDRQVVTGTTLCGFCGYLMRDATVKRKESK